MNKSILLAALAPLALAACGGGDDEVEMRETRSLDADSATVTVTVNNVRPNSGPVLGALQSEGEFAQAAASYTAQTTANAGTVTLTFEGVEPGEYAVAVFQDINNDGSVEIGRTGPMEPWAISGGQTGGAPTFDGSMMMVEGNARTSVDLAVAN